MKVVLDTNFIIEAMKRKIALFEEFYDFIILESVILELKEISENRNETTKNKQAASLALEIIKRNKIKIIVSNGYADNEIIRLVEKEGFILASMDRELKDKLKGKARFMSIKGKKLEIR